MKPLFMTYSNEAQPFLRMAQDLCHQVDKLDAGDCYHLCINEPGANRNWYAECYTRFYEIFEKEIDDRPIIILDADHILCRSIIEIFESDWDVAAVYRKRCVTEFGRQDYCAGLVMFNNKRPDVVRKFYLEWLEKMKARPPVPGYCPATLKNAGWLDTWWIDQSALNDIIAPIDGEVKRGEIYVINDYKVLSLKNEGYGVNGVFVKHLKGGRKPKQ